jgi:riboflavin kinase / FMN adenylyltransferase
MKRFDGHGAVGDELTGAIVAIGNFDGLHRGHQALFARTLERARERAGLAAALTFEPHPAKVLAPRFAPPLILTLAEKLEGLAEAGLQATVVEPFDRAFSAMSPRAFVNEVLLGGLRAGGVVVGPDFSFGHKGEGKVAELRSWLAKGGASLDVVPVVLEDGMVCSSTKVRELVREGRVDAAAVLLGRTYSVRGIVAGGDKRGKRMGLPTANLATERELLPRIGVYATGALLAHGRLVPSVTNVGLRPTFSGEGVRIEAHLLDFNDDLYGQPMEVVFYARLRDEVRFASADELRTQVHQDIAAARRALSTRTPFASR